MPFVNLSRILDLNRDKAEEMGQRAVGEVQPFANQAHGSAERLRAGFNDGSAETNVLAAKGKMGLLDSTGGMGALIGGSPLDAALAGQSNTVGQFRQRTGNLDKLLSGAQEGFQHRQNEAFFAGQRADAANQQRAEDDARKAEDERLMGLYNEQTAQNDYHRRMGHTGYTTQHGIGNRRSGTHYY